MVKVTGKQDGIKANKNKKEEDTKQMSANKMNTIINVNKKE